MEVIIIGLFILLGISILSLGAIVVINIRITSEDRRELQRLVKARDLREYTQYTPVEVEEEQEQEIELVELENIGDYIGENKIKE